MHETELVMKLIQELSSRNCNGYARLKIGTALVDVDTFCHIYDVYARGTYFEQVELQIERIPPRISCSCGYDAAVEADAVTATTCPRCGEMAELSQGREFEITEPRRHPERSEERTFPLVTQINER